MLQPASVPLRGHALPGLLNRASGQLHLAHLQSMPECNAHRKQQEASRVILMGWCQVARRFDSGRPSLMLHTKQRSGRKMRRLHMPFAIRHLSGARAAKSCGCEETGSTQPERWAGRRGRKGALNLRFQFVKGNVACFCDISRVSMVCLPGSDCPACSKQESSSKDVVQGVNHVPGHVRRLVPPAHQVWSEQEASGRSTSAWECQMHMHEIS